MLKMPENPGLIPFGVYPAWRGVNNEPNSVFVRSHTDLGNGLFLIEFTNAKSGKSRAWRTAVVREARVRVMDSNQTYQPSGQPTWEELGIAKTGTRFGEAMFKATVTRPQKGEEWRHKYDSFIYGETLDEVTRDMVALVRSIYHADLPA